MSSTLTRETVLARPEPLEIEAGSRVSAEFHLLNKAGKHGNTWLPSNQGGLNGTLRVLGDAVDCPIAPGQSFVIDTEGGRFAFEVADVMYPIVDGNGEDAEATSMDLVMQDAPDGAAIVKCRNESARKLCDEGNPYAGHTPDQICITFEVTKAWDRANAASNVLPEDVRDLITPKLRERIGKLLSGWLTRSSA